MWMGCMVSPPAFLKPATGFETHRKLIHSGKVHKCLISLNLDQRI